MLYDLSNTFDNNELSIALGMTSKHNCVFHFRLSRRYFGQTGIINDK